MAEEQKRARGRPVGSGDGLKKYAVTLPPDLAEWAKGQDKGLSDYVRKLLLTARQRNKQVSP